MRLFWAASEMLVVREQGEKCQQGIGEGWHELEWIEWDWDGLRFEEELDGLGWIVAGWD